MYILTTEIVEFNTKIYAKVKKILSLNINLILIMLTCYSTDCFFINIYYKMLKKQ
jgi:hypothetical protein